MSTFQEPLPEGVTHKIAQNWSWKKNQAKEIPLDNYAFVPWGRTNQQGYPSSPRRKMKFKRGDLISRRGRTHKRTQIKYTTRKFAKNGWMAEWIPTLNEDKTLNLRSGE